MSIESDHTETDNDMIFTNCNHGNLNMNQQMLHGGIDPQMNLRFGRFGDCSRFQIEPRRIPPTARNVAEVAVEHPVSLSAHPTVYPTINPTVHQRKPVNASILMSPIMMVKYSSRVQPNAHHQNVAVASDHNNTTTQVAYPHNVGQLGMDVPNRQEDIGSNLQYPDLGRNVMYGSGQVETHDQSQIVNNTHQQNTTNNRQSTEAHGAGQYNIPDQNTQFPLTGSQHFPGTGSSYFPGTCSSQLPVTGSQHFPGTGSSYFPGTCSSQLPVTGCQHFPGTDSQHFPRTGSQHFPGTGISQFAVGNQHFIPQGYPHMYHSKVQENANTYLSPQQIQQIQYSSESDPHQYNLDPRTFDQMTYATHDQHIPTWIHTQPTGRNMVVPNSQNLPQEIQPHGDYIFNNRTSGIRLNGMNSPGIYPLETSTGRSLNSPYGHQRTSSQNVSIHFKERSEVRKYLKPRKVIQVCGPPMAGKSTIVRQAISDASTLGNRYGQLHGHHISCKTVSTFEDLLTLLVQKFSPQHLNVCQLDTDAVLNVIHESLLSSELTHHILVFHKCENLSEYPQRIQFVDFIGRIVNEFSTIPVTVVMTTYKYYWLPLNEQNKFVNIDVLSIEDIITMLTHYVPRTDCVSYAEILVKVFCFPEAIRLIVEEFLADEGCRVTPEMLEKKINNDQDFLSQLFECRLPEVDTWIPNKYRNLLFHFLHSVENSFTEAHLEYVIGSELEQIDLNKSLPYLKCNNVVRSLPTINRLVVHPLVVYHQMTTANRERQLLPSKWFDNSCNRYTYFLGRVLLSAEANMQEHGRKGLVFGGLFQEWPSVRYVIQMALHCNQNTYETFMKIAVSASGYILKFFPREAESFYLGLYSSARDYGTQCEIAVIEAMLGQALAEGTGRDWTGAERYLTSAIEHLSEFGNSYFLGWAIDRKAIVMHRQGKYQESLRYFSEARYVLRNVNRWALGEAFSVSDAKIEEEIITQEIHETIPYIFTGHNQKARQRLDQLLDLVQNSFENHPELPNLLNLVGLTEQRGNKDMDRAIRWYKLSYQERMYFAKMCPENLLAVLNNIGMVLFHHGKLEESMKYLQKALDIRRECGWTHYATGLTLVHVAEIYMKMGKFSQSMKKALEADRIFAATVKDHDMRLRVNFVLAHLRIAIRQEHSNSQCFGSGQGCAGWQRTNNPSNQHPHHNPYNSPQVWPANFIHETETEIEPCDLQMSPEDYLERLFVIADNMEGTRSDDGLSLILCSFEHSMLLNWGNSEKFMKLQNAFLKFSEDNPWVEETGEMNGAGVDSRYRCLIKHKPIYLYIRDTPYTHLNMDDFINYLRNTCLTCMFASNIFSTNLWVEEATHSMERQLRREHLRVFDLMRENPLPSETSNSIRSEIINPVSARTRPNSENDITIPGINNIVQENNSPILECIPKSRLQRDSPLVTNRTGMSKETSLQSQFQNVHKLKSNPSITNQHSTPQRHDSDKSVDVPHLSELDEDQSFYNLSCESSFISPRIVNDQKYILTKIQSCRTSSSSSLPETDGAELETNLLYASAGSKKTSHDTKTRTCTLPSARVPVEQSFSEYEDSNWSGDDEPVTLNIGELQSNLCKEGLFLTELLQQSYRLSNEEPLVGAVSRNHGRQTVTEVDNHGRPVIRDTQHSSITTDNSNHQTPPYDLISKLRLVQQEGMPVLTSHDGCSYGSNPVFQLGSSEYKIKPVFQQTISSDTPKNIKFNVVDYLIRNDINMNTSKFDESDPQRNESHEKQYFSNVQNYIQGIVTQSSEGHQILSIRDVKSSDHNSETNTESGSVSHDTKVDLPVCTQTLPELHTSQSENNLVFQVQHTGHIVSESVSDRGLKIVQPSADVQLAERKLSGESQSSSDSGLDSLKKTRLNETNQSRISSENLNLSQRSSSSSSYCGRHAQNVTALDSGYSSQQPTGARPKTYSCMDKHHGNVTSAARSKCKKYQSSSQHNTKHCRKYLLTNQDQAFSEIRNNGADTFEPESDTFEPESDLAYNRRHKQDGIGRSGIIRADTTCQNSQQHEESDLDVFDHTSGLSNILKTSSVGGHDLPSLSRKPVEESWIETLIPNDYQSRAEYLSAPDDLAVELQQLEIRSCHSQNSTENNDEEIFWNM